MTVKVYFAGKVTCNGWREEILSVRDGINEEMCLRGSKLKDIELPIPNSGFRYCGPILLGDDHGSYHGDNTHGAGVGKSQYDVMSEVKPLTQKQLFKLCISCIDKADVIFCYIDDMSAYGTLFELGYAYGKGIPIYLYFSKELSVKQAEDLWFASVKAVRKKRVSSAKEAFEEFKSLHGDMDALDEVLEKERLEEPATVKQLQYIEALAIKKGIFVANTEQITKPMASDIIVLLKSRGKTIEIPERLEPFLIKVFE